LGNHKKCACSDDLSSKLARCTKKIKISGFCETANAYFIYVYELLRHQYIRFKCDQ